MPNTSDVSRTFGNVRMEYTPMSWLKVDYTLGGDWSADERSSVFPKSSSDFPTGRMIRGDLVNFEVDHNLVVTADYDSGPGHHRLGRPGSEPQPEGVHYGTRSTVRT